MGIQSQSDASCFLLPWDAIFSGLLREGIGSLIQLVTSYAKYSVSIRCQKQIVFLPIYRTVTLGTISPAKIHRYTTFVSCSGRPVLWSGCANAIIKQSWPCVFLAREWRRTWEWQSKQKPMHQSRQPQPQALHKFHLRSSHRLQTEDSSIHHIWKALINSRNAWIMLSYSALSHTKHKRIYVPGKGGSYIRVTHSP